MTPYYEDDYVTIYHGDSLDVLPTIAAGTVDAVITDPPYIIGAVSSGDMNTKAGSWADMMNGSLWFSSWYRMVDRILKRSGVFWTFTNWRSIPVVMRAAIDARLPVTSLAVWDKRWIGPSGPQGLRSSYELIALLAQPEFAILDRGTPDVIPFKVGSYKPHGHPAEKPQGLLSQLIAMSAVPDGGLIVDPFLGSGTTARAAKDAQLRCIGIEAEERYCEIAARRMGQEVLDLGGVE